MVVTDGLSPLNERRLGHLLSHLPQWDSVSASVLFGFVRVASFVLSYCFYSECEVVHDEGIYNAVFSVTECNPVSQQREKYFGFSLFSCLFSPSHECLVPFYLCIFDKDRKFCPMAPAYEWKYNSKLFVTRKVGSCPLTVLNFFQFQAVGQPEFECATPPITFDRRASAQVASQGNLYWLQALSDWQRFANKCCL